MRKGPPWNEKFSILIALLFLLGGCSRNSGRVLEGEWITKDRQGQETRLVFGPGARFRAIDAKGGKADGTYWEDFRQKPAWLDLKFSNGDMVQTIVRVKEDTLEIQSIKPNEERPKDFSADAIIYSKTTPILLTPSPSPRSKR